MTLHERVQSYLGNGGLFNPEMMEHEKVRDLIMALDDENAKLLSALDKLVSAHFTHPDHVPEEFRTLLE